MRFIIILAVFGLFYQSNADIYNDNNNTLYRDYSSQDDYYLNPKYKLKLSYEGALLNQLLTQDSYDKTKQDFIHSLKLQNRFLYKDFFSNVIWGIEETEVKQLSSIGITSYLVNSQDNFSNKVSDHSIFAEEVTFGMKRGGFELKTGFFEPHFGQGAVRMDEDLFDNDWYGFAGTALNDSYRIRNKIGLNARYVLSNQDYANEVSVSFFTSNKGDFGEAWSKDYNHSIFRQNNSDDSMISSYTLNWRGFVNTSKNGKLLWNTSYYKMTPDKSISSKNETAWTVALQYYNIIEEVLKLGLFTEYTLISNYHNEDKDGNYLGLSDVKYNTIALYANLENFIGNIVYNKHQYEGSRLDIDTKSIEFSIGYDTKSNLGFRVGHIKYDYTSGSKYTNQFISFRYKIDY